MKDLEQAYRFISNNCEPLYTTLFEFHFRDEHKDAVLTELKKYQNSDGGFGNGLEPDFTLPDSSPIATTIAFQILDDIQVTDHPIIDKALTYLEKSFDSKNSRWWAVPESVNDYSHAPWWAYDSAKKRTVIDDNWGNPTSEIIGILYRYRDSIKGINLAELIDYAITNLNNIENWESFHEIYCYLKMYRDLPGHYREQLIDKLTDGVLNLICLDRTKWSTYVAKPLDFIQSPTHPLFSVIQPYVEENINFLKESQTDGLWFPTWQWTDFLDDWEVAKVNWTAKLTINNYRILQHFDTP